MTTTHTTPESDAPGMARLTYAVTLALRVVQAVGLFVAAVGTVALLQPGTPRTFRTIAAAVLVALAWVAVVELLRRPVARHAGA